MIDDWLTSNTCFTWENGWCSCHIKGQVIKSSLNAGPSGWLFFPSGTTDWEHLELYLGT